MQIVFMKATYNVVQMSGFFRKLRRFVGVFRIEQQSIEDSIRGYITFSFYTDKVKINEGESNQVDLEAKRNRRGSWYFTRLSKY